MTTIYGPIKFMADEFMRNVGERSKEVISYLYPPIRMYEENEHLIIEAELPGFEKKHIHVRIDRNSVEISANRKTEERNNVYIDQRPDKIFKTIRLPVDVETDAQHTAKYTDGVLTITVPIKGFKSIKID